MKVIKKYKYFIHICHFICVNFFRLGDNNMDTLANKMTNIPSIKTYPIQFMHIVLNFYCFVRRPNNKGIYLNFPRKMCLLFTKKKEMITFKIEWNIFFFF